MPLRHVPPFLLHMSGCAHPLHDATGLDSAHIQALPPEGDGPVPADGPPHPPPFSQAEFVESLQVFTHLRCPSTCGSLCKPMLCLRPNRERRWHWLHVIC